MATARRPTLGPVSKESRKSVILPALTKDLQKRRRASSRLRFMPGPADIQAVVKNTLDQRIESTSGLLLTDSKPQLLPKTPKAKPLSLWEKLALASQDESKRRLSSIATDSIGLDLKTLHLDRRDSNKPASSTDAISDDTDIEFGFPGTPSQSSASETEGDDSGKPKRFRVLARMVKNNLAWAREIRDKHDEDTTRFVVNNHDDGETLVFDLNNFRFHQRSYGGLTPRARRILLKHPIERSESELQTLREVVDRLKCFQKYHRKIKQEIARVIYYETFEDGRIIIQQGHSGVSFYFIVSGKVQVKFEELDKKTGLIHTQLLGELCEGSSFGELALLHNIKRTATIVCKGNNCEFLRVDKADFESILRESYEYEWQERLKMLTPMPYFKTWSESAMSSLNNTCKIKEYLSGAVILSHKTKGDDHVYFVSFGECLIVREILLLIEPLPYGGQKVIFPSEELRKKLLKKRDLMDRRYSMYHKAEQRFWQVCSLKAGNYFNTGEDLTDTYIIANDRVECLLIPKMQFVKYGNNKVLDRMKEDLNATIPSNEQAFKQYISDHRWQKYRRSIVSEVLRRKPTNRKFKAEYIKHQEAESNAATKYLFDELSELNIAELDSSPYAE